MASRGGVITGWGKALPDRVVTNHDLTQYMDTSHDWIVERTGIHERRWGGTTAGLAAEAGQKALDKARVAASDVDLVILATTTPDQGVPATAPHVQDALGLKCGAVDLNAACSGFVYALTMAHGMLDMGLQRILIVGAEVLSRITDPSDRSTGMLFADGAGAVLLEAVEGEGELLGFDLGCDGSARNILFQNHGGFLEMDGKEVFRRAVRAMVDSTKSSLERAKMTPADLDWVIPHQANKRIIEAANQRLGLPMERTSLTLTRVGNTSSASIPFALAEALDEGKIENGDHVLLCGFGAGMTWASAVLRWGGVVREGAHGPALWEERKVIA